MWHSEWGLLLCTAGIARNLWGATKGKQFTKADRADLSRYIFYYLKLCYDRHHHIHTHKPDEDDLARRKESR